MYHITLSRQRWVILTATFIWGSAVAIGLLALQLHGASPGQSGSAVERWPGESRIPLTAGRPTMVVAVHPLCPCTRASVSELARLLTRCDGQVEVYILIFLPERAGRGWGPTAGLRGLATMPGVHLIDDPAGEEAARFGAQTSGLVALYAQDGRLLFRGGITAARGHEGDNEGRRALLDLIQGNSSSCPRETPVFGCPIFPRSIHLRWNCHVMEVVNLVSERGPGLKRRLCPDVPKNFSSSTDRDLNRATDRLFSGLLAFEWLAAILTALVIAPRAWSGTTSWIHPHIWAATLLGGAIVSLPITLAWFQPGRPLTRHVIAVTQMLIGTLMIHLTGGRIETHFYVFGSLAFLAFYRDWKVLVSASVVVAADHVIRGFFWPQSVYGVALIEPWRWVEHAGWVAFEDVFLIWSCRRSIGEMWAIAERQAALEILHSQVEHQVAVRTAELRESEARQDRYRRGGAGCDHDGRSDRPGDRVQPGGGEDLRLQPRPGAR